MTSYATIFRDKIAGKYLAIIIVKEICIDVAFIAFGIFVGITYFEGASPLAAQTAGVIIFAMLIWYAMLYTKKYFWEIHRKYLDNFDW